MSAHANGRAGAGALRRMPVRTITVALQGDYEGFTVTMRSNPPLRTFTEIQSNADFESLRKIVATLVIDWNFVDEEGQPIPTGDFDSISIELFGLIIQQYLSTIVSATAVPKA